MPPLFAHDPLDAVQRAAQRGWMLAPATALSVACEYWVLALVALATYAWLESDVPAALKAFLPMALALAVGVGVVAAGAAMGLGGPVLGVDSRADERAVELLAGALTDSRVRSDLVAAGRRIVDGLGAWRVVQTWEMAHRGESREQARSASDPVTLVARPATLQDARLLWQWRNDPATRAGSTSSTTLADWSACSVTASSVASPAIASSTALSIASWTMCSGLSVRVNCPGRSRTGSRPLRTRIDASL